MDQNEDAGQHHDIFHTDRGVHPVLRRSGLRELAVKKNIKERSYEHIRKLRAEVEALKRLEV